MLRFTAFAVLFAAVCALPINDNLKSGGHDVIVVDNIMNDHYTGMYIYTFGLPVIGERLIASKEDKQEFSTPSHAKTTIEYQPNAGKASIVSRVIILVDQDTNIGGAYVFSGGVGQKEISVVTEAKNATIFEYRAEIYGYDAPL